MSTFSLIVLKNGLTLVSESDQLDYEPSCHLIDPMTFSGTTKVTLKAWPEHSGDSHILLRSEDLLTVCEPSEALLASYLKKTGKVLTEETKEVTIESEAPTPPEYVAPTPPEYGDMPSDDDEYEPHYIEDSIL